MYVIDFTAYELSEQDKTPSALTFRFIRQAFKHRRFDPALRAFVPLLLLGNDPERADAFRELMKYLERAEHRDVAHGDAIVLTPAGALWEVDDRTYDLLREGIRKLRETLAGADDLDDFETVDRFLTPTPDGPTRKLTQEQHRQWAEARSEGTAPEPPKKQKARG